MPRGQGAVAPALAQHRDLRVVLEPDYDHLAAAGRTAIAGAFGRSHPRLRHGLKVDETYDVSAAIDPRRAAAGPGGPPRALLSDYGTTS